MAGNPTIINNQPTPNQIKIGFNGTWEALIGDIAEIIIYDRALSPEEIFTVNTYLANKYCLNTTVPMPVASNQSSCGAGSVTLTASGGIHYRWYADTNTSTPLDTTAAYTTPILFATDTFYVANYNDTLESARTMVIAAVNPIPIVSIDLSSIDTLCTYYGITNLVGESPIGGIYSGTNVSGNTFDPSIGIGTYTITYTYTDANSCSNTASDSIIVDICTSINEPVNNSFSIYPNPTNGQFTILLPTDNGIITLTDMLGQRILKTQTTQKTTNLELVNNGVYIVYFTTKQGTTARKLIVNH